MTPHAFVLRLSRECRDSALEQSLSSLLNPPGRRPPEELVRLSRWFIALPESERKMVESAMREASDATLFGVLCVLDGVRAIESTTEKSEFELAAVKGGVRSELLPGPDALHDLWRREP